MDIWTKKKRSHVMSRILGKNTKPEQLVRRMLSKMGHCYRLHTSKLPGKPDVVLKKYKAVIFVHGCFWHLHSGCRDGTIPKSRKAYWETKLLNNKKRDIRSMRLIKKAGWNALRLWECEIENEPESVLKKLRKLIPIKPDASGMLKKYEY